MRMQFPNVKDHGDDNVDYVKVTSSKTSSALLIVLQISFEVQLIGFSRDTVEHVVGLASVSQATIDNNDDNITTISYLRGFQYPVQLSSLDRFKAGVEEVKGHIAASNIATDPTIRYVVMVKNTKFMPHMIIVISKLTTSLHLPLPLRHVINLLLFPVFFSSSYFFHPLL